MDTEAPHGLTVHSSDRRVVGVVVAAFREGLLAGRLRVEGEYSILPYKGRLQERIAVYAIPPCAVREHRGRLVLGVTFHQVRWRWLVQVRELQQMVPMGDALPAHRRAQSAQVGTELIADDTPC